MNDNQIEGSSKKRSIELIKKVATIVGILVGITTILTGIYAAILEYQKFKITLNKERFEHELKLQKQKVDLEKEIKSREILALKAEEERSRQLSFKLQIEKEKSTQKKIEVEGNVEIEKEKTKQEKYKKDQIFLDKKLKEEQAKEEIRKKQEELAIANEKKFYSAINIIVDNNNPEFGSLLYLLNLDPKKNIKKELLLDALVTRADRSNSLGEIDLIFKILNKYKYSAMDNVIRINKNATYRFNENLEKLFLYHLSSFIKPDERGYKTLKNDIVSLLYSLPDNFKNIDRNYQNYIMAKPLEQIFNSIKDKVNKELLSNQIKNRLIGFNKEILFRKISADVALIMKSQEFLSNFILRLSQTNLLIRFFSGSPFEINENEMTKILDHFNLDYIQINETIDLSNTYMMDVFNCCSFELLDIMSHSKFKDSIAMSSKSFHNSFIYGDAISEDLKENPIAYFEIGPNSIKSFLENVEEIHKKNIIDKLGMFSLVQFEVAIDDFFNRYIRGRFEISEGLLNIIEMSGFYSNMKELEYKIHESRDLLSDIGYTNY